MSFDAAMQSVGKSRQLKMDTIMEDLGPTDGAQLRKHLENPLVPASQIVGALKLDEFKIIVSRDAVDAWRRHNGVSE